MSSKSSNKRRKLKPKARITLFIGIIFFFLLSIFLIINGFNIKDDSTNNLVYSYTTNKDLNYKVRLYQNSFIEDEYLGMNESYISDLVKTIEANFLYNYIGSKIVPLNYEYSIDANIRGEYQLKDENTSTQVWNKEYPLIEKKTGTVKELSQFSINEQVEIDYHFFDSIVSEFRQELKLPISAELLVNFKVVVKGSIENEPIEDTKTITVRLPLNLQAFKIESEFEKTASNNIYTTNESKININYTSLILGITMLIGTLMVFIRLFRRLFNINKKTAYQIKRDKYLKEYGEVIIEVMTPLINTDLQQVEVKNFNEMIDLEEELRIPISFYEDEDDEYGEFTIIHNDVIYIYVLDEDKE